MMSERMEQSSSVLLPGGHDAEGVLDSSRITRVLEELVHEVFVALSDDAWLEAAVHQCVYSAEIEQEEGEDDEEAAEGGDKKRGDGNGASPAENTAPQRREGGVSFERSRRRRKGRGLVPTTHLSCLNEDTLNAFQEALVNLVAQEDSAAVIDPALGVSPLVYALQQPKSSALLHSILSIIFQSPDAGIANLFGNYLLPAIRRALPGTLEPALRQTTGEALFKEMPSSGGVGGLSEAFLKNYVDPLSSGSDASSSSGGGETGSAAATGTGSSILTTLVHSVMEMRLGDFAAKSSKRKNNNSTMTGATQQKYSQEEDDSSGRDEEFAALYTNCQVSVLYPSLPHPVTDQVNLTDSLSQYLQAYRTIFLGSGEMCNYYKLLATFPQALVKHHETMQTLLFGPGPVPIPQRLIVAIMAASEHNNNYLFRRFCAMFTTLSQDIAPNSWLLGEIPQKVKELVWLNVLGAHRPWLLPSEGPRILHQLTTKFGWTIPELLQIMMILSTVHGLAGFTEVSMLCIDPSTSCIPEAAAPLKPICPTLTAGGQSSSSASSVMNATTNGQYTSDALSKLSPTGRGAAHCGAFSPALQSDMTSSGGRHPPAKQTERKNSSAGLDGDCTKSRPRYGSTFVETAENSNGNNNSSTQGSASVVAAASHTSTTPEKEKSNGTTHHGVDGGEDDTPEKFVPPGGSRIANVRPQDLQYEKRIKVGHHAGSGGANTAAHNHHRGAAAAGGGVGKGGGFEPPVVMSSINVATYNWDDHGSALVDRYLGDQTPLARLISDETECWEALCDGPEGASVDPSVVAKQGFISSMSVWWWQVRLYVMNLYGVIFDEFSGEIVNNIIAKEVKKYVHRVVCVPEETTLPDVIWSLEPQTQQQQTATTSAQAGGDGTTVILPPPQVTDQHKILIGVVALQARRMAELIQFCYATNRFLNADQ